MPSFQYRYSHHKDKMLWWPFNFLKNMQYWKCALYIVGLSQDCSYVFASAVELMQFALKDGYGSMLLWPPRCNWHVLRTEHSWPITRHFVSASQDPRMCAWWRLPLGEPGLVLRTCLFNLVISEVEGKWSWDHFPLTLRTGMLTR